MKKNALLNQFPRPRLSVGPVFAVLWQRHRNRGRTFVTELISLTVIPGGEAVFREKRTSRVVLIIFRFAGVTESAAEMKYGFVSW